MKDIVKAVVYAGIFLVPAIVLIISNDLFFPFITGKNFTFRIIVEIVFAAWIILALYDAQYRPKFSWILAGFLSLLIVMFFANLNGVYPLQSFWSNFERMDGYVTLVHTFLYLLVAGSVLTTEKLWDRFFMTTIGIAVIVSLYAFAQLSGNIVINQGGWRLDGTLGNSAYMAIYMLFHTFITFFMFMKAKSTHARVIYGGLAVLFIYLLVQTATRGTVLGLVGGSLIMVTYTALFAKQYPHMRKVAGGALLSLVILIGLFVTFKESAFVQTNPYLQRIATISLAEASNRFNIWGMAFQGVKERPLLGWGQSNYGYVFNKYYEPELHGQEAWFDRVHNIVMDWLIAGGIFGTIAYFSIIIGALYYLVFRPLVHKDETFSVVERAVLIGLLSGYFIHNFVVFDNIVSYIFYAAILAFIHARVGTEIPSLMNFKISRSLVEQVVSPVVAVLLCVVIYYVNIPGIQAAGDVIDGFRSSDPREVIASFERALARNSFGTQEIREQMMQRTTSLFQDPNLSDEEKQKLFKRIEEELLKQVEEKKGDARAHVFVSTFYRMTNNTEPAIEQLAIARKLSPRKQLIIFEQGMAEIGRQNYEGAVEFFKEAYELAPQFTDSRVMYAMSAVYAGKLGLVDELINTPEFEHAFAMSDFALQAVYTAKMYPRLTSMLETRIAQNPSDPQMRTSLAFVLNEMGDTPGAVAVLTQAGIDIPSFKAQADTFIQSLTGGGITVTE